MLVMPANGPRKYTSSNRPITTPQKIRFVMLSCIWKKPAPLPRWGEGITSIVSAWFGVPMSENMVKSHFRITSVQRSGASGISGMMQSFATSEKPLRIFRRP